MSLYLLFNVINEPKIEGPCQFIRHSLAFLLKIKTFNCTCIPIGIQYVVLDFIINHHHSMDEKAISDIWPKIEIYISDDSF